MKPIDNIIPRKTDSGISQILSQFSIGIDELVNFGSNIIKWDLQSPIGNDENLPATLFLRNFLEEIDAISIMINSSSIDPCKNLLRAALENFFYLEYILEKDTYNRSMSFLITNAIRNRELVTKFDGKSAAYNEFEKKCKSDKLLKHSKPITLKNVNAFMHNSDKLLNSDKYHPFKTEYDKTRHLLKKKPNWYSLFEGPRTIEELAKYLKYPALYEILYRGWSPSSHGSDIIQGKISATHDGKAEIIQIRYAKDAQNVTKHCFNLSFLLFRNFIQKRVSLHLPEYLNWYLEIREFSMKLSGASLINYR